MATFGTDAEGRGNPALSSCKLWTGIRRRPQIYPSIDQTLSTASPFEEKVCTSAGLDGTYPPGPFFPRDKHKAGANNQHRPECDV